MTTPIRGITKEKYGSDGSDCSPSQDGSVQLSGMSVLPSANTGIEKAHTSAKIRSKRFIWFSLRDKLIGQFRRVHFNLFRVKRIHAEGGAKKRLDFANRVGIILREEGKFEEALSHMRSVQPFFETDLEYTRKFHNTVGIIYFCLRDFYTAISEYRSVLWIPAETDYEVLAVCAVQGNIANALVEINQIPEAHYYLDLSEATLRRINNETSFEWLADRLETRARAYLKEGKREEARSAILEAYSIMRFSYAPEKASKIKITLNLCFECSGRGEG